MPTADFKVPTLDYTDRDYVAIRDSLISRIPFYTPEWTDRNADDLGIVLLELFAGTADILHYYVDRNAAEGFVDTAITTASHNSLWKLIDYTPIGSVPATVTLTFSEATAAASNHIIPALTRCDTGTVSGEIISFETDVEAVIAAGSTSTTVSATQGITRATSSSREVLGTSTGSVYQVFAISKQPTIDSTIRVWVDEGASTYFEYFVVSSFDLSGPQDRVFKIRKRADGFTEVVFGDGNTGKVPTSTGSVECAYRTGGGLAGNVGAGTINTIVDTLVGFSPGVTNVQSASGGTSPETIKEQKENGPLSLKALNRAVTLDDYRTLAKLIPGVYDAYAYYHLPSGTARVSIAPNGGGAPTTLLKTTVQSTIDAVNCVGSEVEVVDSLVIPIDVLGSVVVTTPSSRSAVEQVVNAAVANFLGHGASTNTSRFGTNVYFSDLICLIDGIDGVDHVDLTKVSRQCVPVLDDFGDSGATITVVTNSGNTIEQVITVKMDKDASSDYAANGEAGYTVTGSTSGLLGAGVAKTSGATTVSMVATGVDFTIKITLTSNSPVGPYDNFYFTIGKYLGNQTISNDEIADDGIITLTYTGGVS